MPRDQLTTRTSGAAEMVGVLGATSFVGRAVLRRLRAATRNSSAPCQDVEGAPSEDRPAALVVAYSRRAMPSADASDTPGIDWRRLPVCPGELHAAIPRWIAACPVWVVPEHIPSLAAAGAVRLVALSSTSRFTKSGSSAASDRAIARRLATAEGEVLTLGRAHGIAVTILRPTMIYDGVDDRNVARIARFIQRAGFYPVAGAARGLRQPIHADDVAAACDAVLSHDRLGDAYDISGGEVLPYHEMVRRIFAWLGKRPRLARIPLPIVRLGTPLASRVPGLASLASMAARMNEDLVFDHGAATADFGFHPRSFTLPTRPDSNHAEANRHRTPRT